jgi:hypothetical protein
VTQPPHHRPAPVANRITATESPTKKACNGLLQQNRNKADGTNAMEGLLTHHEFVGIRRRRP